MPQTLLIFTRGPFANTMTAYLERFAERFGTGNSITKINDLQDLDAINEVQIIDKSNLIVLISDTAAYRIAEKLAQEARAAGAAFLTVYLEMLRLRIGPVVKASEGPCWNCSVRREFQHSSHPTALAALRHSQEFEIEALQTGFLDAHTRQAAALLLLFLQEHAELQTGLVVEIDLHDGKRIDNFVWGVHDCEVCGLQRPAFTRTVDTLEQVLASQYS